MTEFTSEHISNWRNAIKVVAGVRGDIREVEKFSLEALDEIERQRERIAELEAVQAVIMYLHGENERLRATLGLIKSRGMAHGVEWCVTVACTLDREGE